VCVYVCATPKEKVYVMIRVSEDLESSTQKERVCVGVRGESYKVQETSTTQECPVDARHSLVTPSLSNTHTHSLSLSLFTLSLYLLSLSLISLSLPFSWHAQTYAYTYSLTHPTHSLVRFPKYTDTYRHMCSQIYTRTHTCIHQSALAYTHSCVQIHTDTHTQGKRNFTMVCNSP
jgi:hypothetical protein